MSKLYTYILYTKGSEVCIGRMVNNATPWQIEYLDADNNFVWRDTATYCWFSDIENLYKEFQKRYPNELITLDHEKLYPRVS